MDTEQRKRSTEGRMFRPKAEDFENSASASAAEGFKFLGRRCGRRFEFDVQKCIIKYFFFEKNPILCQNFISVHLLKHQFPFDFQGSFYIHLNLSTRGMRYEKQLSETILQTSLNFHENKKQKLATKNY